MKSFEGFFRADSRCRASFQLLTVSDQSDVNRLKKIELSAVSIVMSNKQILIVNLSALGQTLATQNLTKKCKELTFKVNW